MPHRPASAFRAAGAATVPAAASRMICLLLAAATAALALPLLGIVPFPSPLP